MKRILRSFVKSVSFIMTVVLTLLLCSCGSDNKSSAYSSGTLSHEMFDTDSGSDISSVFASETPYSASSFTENYNSNHLAGSDTSFSTKNSSQDSSVSSVQQSIAPAENNGFLKGIWMSFYEVDGSGLNAENYRNKILGMMKNAYDLGYNAVFCHVRAMGDAYYPSKYYPFAQSFTGVSGKNPGYDPLSIMISCAKQYGLQFHAWINPYRVRSNTTDTSVLCDSDVAKKWAADNSGRVVIAAGGIYYNPCCADVQKLVLNGVREILNGYKIDGIHFDDYFYPTTDAKFDETQYNAYNASGGKLSLGDWRRANVNNLVSAVYRICKAKTGVSFGISPSAHISNDKSDKNYNSLYADIALWMSNKGYVDYIAPQLYFGYTYPDEEFQYSLLLKKWITMKRSSGIKLYIGIAGYKLTEPNILDMADFRDAKGNLLARQCTDAKNAKTDGVIVFSYSYCTKKDEHSVKETQNLKNCFKNT